MSSDPDCPLASVATEDLLRLCPMLLSGNGALAAAAEKLLNGVPSWISGVYTLELEDAADSNAVDRTIHLCIEGMLYLRTSCVKADGVSENMRTFKADAFMQRLQAAASGEAFAASSSTAKWLPGAKILAEALERGLLYSCRNVEEYTAADASSLQFYLLVQLLRLNAVGTRNDVWQWSASGAEAAKQKLDGAIRENDATVASDLLNRTGRITLDFHVGLKVPAAGNKYQTSSTTPLIWAIDQGHDEVMQLLLARGATVDFQAKGSLRTPLMAAVARQSEAVTRKLIELKAIVNAHDRFAITALGLASCYGATAVMKLLLDAGARIDAVNHDGVTSLHGAINNNRPESVDTLLKRGANPRTAVGSTGVTPLMLASLLADAKVLKLLIAELSATRDTGASSDLDSRTQIPVYKFATAAGVWVTAQKGQTALAIAILANSVEAVEALLDAGANPNASEHKGNILALGTTCLHAAILQGQTKIVESLLRHGADPRREMGNRGISPLMLAAMLPDSAILNMLLRELHRPRSTSSSSGSAAADLEVRAKTATEVSVNGAMAMVTKGFSALAIAISSGCVSSVKALVQAGADHLAVDDERTPALIAAICENNLDDESRIEIIKLLLAGGADVHAMDRYHILPLHEAANRGCEDIMQLLIEVGKADVNKLDGNGYAPLHQALFDWSQEKQVYDASQDVIRAKRSAVVQLLLAHGADAALCDSDGKSPGDYAAEIDDSASLRLINANLEKRRLQAVGQGVTVQSGMPDAPSALATSSADSENAAVASKAVRFVSRGGGSSAAPSRVVAGTRVRKMAPPVPAAVPIPSPSSLPSSGGDGMSQVFGLKAGVAPPDTAYDGVWMPSTGPGRLLVLSSDATLLHANSQSRDLNRPLQPTAVQVELANRVLAMRTALEAARAAAADGDGWDMNVMPPSLNVNCGASPRATAQMSDTSSVVPTRAGASAATAWPARSLLEPIPATLAHSSGYLNSLDRVLSSLYGTHGVLALSEAGTLPSAAIRALPPFHDAADTLATSGTAAAVISSATISRYAIDAVLEGRRLAVLNLVRPPGHHVGDRGKVREGIAQGFCVLNTAMMQAKYAILKHAADGNEGPLRVFIFDFDAHNSNGAEELVKADAVQQGLFEHVYTRALDNYRIQPAAFGGNSSDPTLIEEATVDDYKRNGGHRKWDASAKNQMYYRYGPARDGPSNDILRKSLNHRDIMKLRAAQGARFVRVEAASRSDAEGARRLRIADLRPVTARPGAAPTAEAISTSAPPAQSKKTGAAVNLPALIHQLTREGNLVPKIAASSGSSTGSSASAASTAPSAVTQVVAASLHQLALRGPNGFGCANIVHSDGLHYGTHTARIYKDGAAGPAVSLSDITGGAASASSSSSSASALAAGFPAGIFKPAGNEPLLASVCIPVAVGEDERSRGSRDVHLANFRNHLLPVLKEFQPHLIIFSAGFDALATDRIGALSLTPADYSTLVTECVDAAGSQLLGVVANTEGGYGNSKAQEQARYAELGQGVVACAQAMHTFAASRSRGIAAGAPAVAASSSTSSDVESAQRRACAVHMGRVLHCIASVVEGSALRVAPQIGASAAASSAASAATAVEVDVDLTVDDDDTGAGAGAGTSTSTPTPSAPSVEISDVDDDDDEEPEFAHQDAVDVHAMAFASSGHRGFQGSSEPALDHSHQPSGSQRAPSHELRPAGSVMMSFAGALEQDAESASHAGPADEDDNAALGDADVTGGDDDDMDDGVVVGSAMQVAELQRCRAELLQRKRDLEQCKELLAECSKENESHASSLSANLLAAQKRLAALRSALAASVTFIDQAAGSISNRQDAAADGTSAAALKTTADELVAALEAAGFASFQLPNSAAVALEVQAAAIAHADAQEVAADKQQAAQRSVEAAQRTVDTLTSQIRRMQRRQLIASKIAAFGISREVAAKEADAEIAMREAMERQSSAIAEPPSTSAAAVTVATSAAAGSAGAGASASRSTFASPPAAKSAGRKRQRDEDVAHSDGDVVAGPSAAGRHGD